MCAEDCGCADHFSREANVKTGLLQRSSWLSRQLESPLRWAVLAGVLIILAVLGMATWRHFGPVLAGSQWQVDVYMDNVARVSALSLDEKGNLFISQEFDNEQGDIFEREADGELTTLVQGLSKPDGMIFVAGGFVFSQEQGQHWVIWSNGQVDLPLFEAENVEGLAVHDTYLYAVEDVKGHGRLLRFDLQNLALEVLREGLDEAEGVASCPNGDLYYVEKGRATVWKFNPAGRDSAIAMGLNEPGMVMCDSAGVWITEDATHMARVLLIGRDGILREVLTHLRSPQTIVRLSSGQYLVAEQGRNRILKLKSSELLSSELHFSQLQSSKKG